VLVATGRKADLASLGVGAIGQDEHASYLEVDENMRAAPGVWALGDVVGKGAHTHMALYHGRVTPAAALARSLTVTSRTAIPLHIGVGPAQTVKHGGLLKTQFEEI
jgi:pyruvate/2-oxoglutarate dehydrogenase complex dihydrolipoamide dehydrogenase (E3) component